MIRGIRMAALLAAAVMWANNAFADYWRITFGNHDGQSLEYLFKIDAFDFTEVGKDDRYRRSTARRTTLNGPPYVSKDIFILDAFVDSTRYSLRDLVSVTSTFGPRYGGGCPIVKQTIRFTNGEEKTSTGTRPDTSVPVVFIGLNDKFYYLTRISGSAFAVRGDNGSKPVGSSQRDFSNLDVYDLPHNAAMNGIGCHGEKVVAAKGSSPPTGDYYLHPAKIEFLTEEDGRAQLNQVVEARAQAAYKRNNMAAFMTLKGIADADVDARLDQEAKAFWYEKYKDEAAAIFETKNPNIEALRAFSEKLPIGQARGWSDIDFDNLAAKAAKLYEPQHAREVAEANRKMAIEHAAIQAAEAKERAAIQATEAKERRLQQEARAAEQKKLTAFRKSLKIGDDTFCGPVIEVRYPMIKIAVSAQLPGYTSEAWLKASEVYPAQYGCRNENGRLSSNS